MNVLSLFDGISCGQVALNKLNLAPTNYYASEIQQSAINITQRNFRFTQQLGCVTKITNIPLKINLLFGGSPCQGFSLAGKQLNFDDPRSKLFFDFVRVMELAKPDYFLFENVKMKKEWVDIISGYLGVEPIAINSADFLPQNRQRLYWTNLPIKPWEPSPVKLVNLLEPGWTTDRDVAYCIDASYGKGTNLKRYLFRGSRQIAFNQNANLDEIFDLYEDNCNEYGKLNKEVWRRLTVLECERLQGLPEGYTAGESLYDRYHAIGNGWTVPVIEHILESLAA